MKSLYRRFIITIGNKNWALGISCCVLILSYGIERCAKVDNLFASSGSILTIFGLIISVNSTYIFAKMHNNKPMSNGAKYNQIHTMSQAMEPPNDNQIKRVVNKRESEEIISSLLIIIGTLIWGFGNYLI